MTLASTISLTCIFVVYLNYGLSGEVIMCALIKYSIRVLNKDMPKVFVKMFSEF